MYTLYIKRISVALCTVPLLMSMGACSGAVWNNYREVDTMQLVQTLGIDAADSALRVTISTGAGSENVPATVISREGESILSAMGSLQDYSAKEELYFAHTRYILIGEEGAKKNLWEIFDYVERNTRIRMDATPLIARGGEAKNLIACSGKKNYEITETLSSIERDIERSGVSHPYTFREVSRSLLEYGGALICSVAGKKTADSVFSESGELTVVPSGYGIIKDGYLIGFLDINEARGANLLMDNFGTAAIELSLSSGRVTLMPDKSSADFTAVFDESGTLRQLLCKIKLDAGLTEMSAPLDLNRKSQQKALDAALSAEVQDWCAGALLSSLESKCDFMGLYGILRDKYPKELCSMEKPFVDTLLEAEVSVSVEGNVKHSYNLERPLAESGEEGQSAAQ